jgi:hypothetical protein
MRLQKASMINTDAWGLRKKSCDTAREKSRLLLVWVLRSRRASSAPPTVKHLTGLPCQLGMPGAKPPFLSHAPPENDVQTYKS